MAQTGFTPILLYASSTPSAAPAAGNLTSSAAGAELALNYADGKLFYKDSGGSVQTLASKATGSIGGSTTQVQYNSSGALAGSANLTFNGTTLTANALTVSTGNLAFSGTAQRITGDMSNATLANRLAFQTSTANSATGLFVLPNGTSQISQVQCFNNSDPTNAGRLQLSASNVEVQVLSSITGTGTYLPMTFYTGGSERVRVDTSGNVGVGTASPAYLLHLNQNGNTQVWVSATNAGSNSAGIGFENAGQRNWQIWADRTNDALQFGNNSRGTTNMVINSSGNVGIGTTSPGQRLDVGGGGNLLLSGASTGDQFIRVGSGRSGNGFSYIDLVGDTTYNNGLRLIRTNSGANSNSNIEHRGTGALQIITQEAGAIVLATAATERMRITATGNIVAGASAALATTATDGFLYVPTCAGTPTGTPTAITGMAPIVVNTTNNKLYFYSGGAWRDAGP